MPRMDLHHASGTFIRTVLGDIADFSKLGICDAHEHIVMTGEWIERYYPEFYRADTEGLLPDLESFRNQGGGWIVDCTPPASGRSVRAIAVASRTSRIPMVAATGMHLTKYYPVDHPLLQMNRDQLAEVFLGEIIHGMDDGSGRTQHRAGVIKVASGRGKLNSFETEVFAAAGRAQAQSGCPIITHTEAGTECHEQIHVLLAHGADASRITLSHCDKISDIQFHRALLQRGVRLEYDQHFRQHLKHEPCVSTEVVAVLGDEFPSQFIFGMDLARNRYWNGYGGRPGLEWLVTELPRLLRQRGLSDAMIFRLTSTNAIEAFSFLPETNAQEPR